jgi:aspartyl-tRNA(Asn)/glutamyl-tRNA(Gln) amidotransferase subunit B
MPEYQAIIGMEVHVELKTKSKMFCACKNPSESQGRADDPNLKEPNTNICPICLAHPGTLPVPNRQAIAWTVLIGRALGCQIRELSKFDRKHYFYPDLPKGYQISQYDEPIAEYGKIALTFPLEENIRDTATIGIRRAHLEEDTAKLTHDAKGNTLVDFNRAGTPLVEIVTDPDFKSALEAKTYCQELRTLFRALGVSDADMEKGHMRCEANISVQTAGSFEIVDGVVKPLYGATLNNKVEVKNINSFRAVERAIAFEIKRQMEMLDRGESWVQQTRGWDENLGETVLQRIKENAQDYRYFPEPDIPPFHPQTIAGELHIPELPAQKRDRFHTEYGFSYSDAQILTNDNAWADYADHVMSELIEWEKNMPHTDNVPGSLAKLAGGWLVSRLMGALADRSIDIRVFRVTPENFAEFIALIHSGRINSTNAQKLLADMIDAGTDIDPTHIMEEKGYGQVRDSATIEKVIDEVIMNYPAQVTQFKSGKEPIIKFLIGMCMKATEGSADPVMIETMLRKRLTE